MTLAAVAGAVGFLLAAPGPATLAARAVPSVQSSATQSSSAAIRTPDVDATADWYVQKLGFRRISDSSTVQGRRVVLERESSLLELEEAVPEQPLARGPDLDVETTGSVGMAAITLVVRDVDAEVARLKKQGAEIVAEPEDAFDEPIRVAYLRDNDGRTIELREPLQDDPGGFHGEGR